MSVKERDRLQVLREVEQRHLKQRQVAGQWAEERDADGARVPGTGHRVDRGPIAASQGAHRAQLRHAAGPPGERAAPGRREANRYLDEEFLPDWDQRFTVQPASGVDAHRPWGELLALESILSWTEKRQVTNDYTVAWEGQRWQIPKEVVRPGLRRSSIRIELRLDGSLMARIEDRFVALSVCQTAEKSNLRPKRPARRHVPPPGQSRWMDHFSVQGNQAWKANRQPAATISAPAPVALRAPSAGLKSK